MSSLTEDKLKQATTAEYFRDVLGWESVYAYNEEFLGHDGTLGRLSENGIVLERYVLRALEQLNPDLPAIAYESAIKQITETSVSKSTLQMNRQKYELSTRDRNRLKKVATELLAALKVEKLRIDSWREKEATKAEVRVFIHDFLYRDDIGLPTEAYSPQEVEERADAIFAHIFSHYSDRQPVYLG
jgi:hypothetical protein